MIIKYKIVRFNINHSLFHHSNNKINIKHCCLPWMNLLGPHRHRHDDDDSEIPHCIDWDSFYGLDGMRLKKEKMLIMKNANILIINYFFHQWLLRKSEEEAKRRLSMVFLIKKSKNFFITEELLTIWALMRRNIPLRSTISVSLHRRNLADSTLNTQCRLRTIPSDDKNFFFTSKSPQGAVEWRFSMFN